MMIPARLLAVAAIAIAGTMPVRAEDPVVQLASAPIDLRPPPAIKKHAMSIAVPLPRLRPTLAQETETEGKAMDMPEVVKTAPIEPDAPPAIDPGAKAVEVAAPAASQPVLPPPMAVQPPAEASNDKPPADAPIAEAPVAPVAKVPVAPPPPPDVAIDDGLPGDPGAPSGPAQPADIGMVMRPSEGLPQLTGEPYELVRTLQLLQDQIAQGSTQALITQRTLRARIDQQFAAAPAAVWQDRRNAAAVVTYVLSGGAPSILARLGTLDPKPAIDEKLVTGVFAYVEGKEAQANDLLAGFDPFDLPPSMGAQLALAQSALAVRSDPAKSMALLDVARLLAPGTLVEEAALRRELFVADQMKATGKVESLARQYLDRFRHSVYAGNFRNRFAAAITHMDFVNDPDQYHRLDDMLAGVEPPARCQLYLTVALAAVIRGNTVAARLSAERAAALAENGTTEQARAQLYRAAALVADAKDFDEATTTFGKVNFDLLSLSDRALHDMVADTMAGVKSGTEAPAKGTGQQVAQLDAAAAPADTPLMKRAGDALKAVDDLLAAAPK